MPGKLIQYSRWRAFSHPPATSGFVRSGDASIHYRTYGSGPPLVLLHGGFSSSLDWFGEIPELAAVRAPTLVIVSSEDFVDTGHARAMAEAIPGAELLVLPGVGHAVPREVPDILLDAIARFLSAPAAESAVRRAAEPNRGASLMIRSAQLRPTSTGV